MTIRNQDVKESELTRAERLVELHRSVREGFHQIERGEFTDYRDGGAVAEAIKRNGRVVDRRQGA